MSKSAPQAPPPPNPALVAQQQTGSNIDTAVAQKALNNTNQYTPFGSTTYQQAGSQVIGGVDVPTYSQTTSFNPAVQSIITGTENAGASLVPAVQTLTDQASKSATTPLTFAGNNQDYLNAGPQLLDRDATSAVYQQHKSFLDPQWQQGQRDLEDQLSRQGISPGSDAYNSAAGGGFPQRHDLHGLHARVGPNARSGGVAGELGHQHGGDPRSATRCWPGCRT
jgi:hypothetical protein